MGNHLALLTPPQIVNSLEYSWIGQIILIHTIGFGKIAVIAFLLRIQDRTNSRKNTVLVYLLYFVGISNVLINIMQSVMILISCNPSQRLWNLAIPGNCNGLERTNHTGYFQGSMFRSICPLMLSRLIVVVSLGGSERCRSRNLPDPRLLECQDIRASQAGSMSAHGRRSSVRPFRCQALPCILLTVFIPVLPLPAP